MDTELLHMELPITRIDATTREVEGRATVEDVDAYKTIFSYDASKQAFSKWMQHAGNIREMHDKHRSIGRAVKVSFDDEQKQVIVRAKISKSADGDNAWTKIEEGILRGFSVGARDGVWDKIERGGKTYDYLKQYELVELSIVDNPATPGCNIEVARADGFTSDVLEDEVDETPTPETVENVVAPEEERFLQKANQKATDALHKVRDGALSHAKVTMQACGCTECSAMQDGDNDGDGLSSSGQGTGAGRELQAEVTRLREITRSLITTPQQQQTMSPDIKRRLDEVEQKLSVLDEVRSMLVEVRGLTEKIAKTPLPGGPVLNGAHKLLATQPDSRQEELARAIQSGYATKDQQLEAASLLVRGEMNRQR